jgi:hypothetical protein
MPIECEYGRGIVTNHCINEDYKTVEISLSWGAKVYLPIPLVCTAQMFPACMQGGGGILPAFISPNSKRKKGKGNMNSEPLLGKRHKGRSPMVIPSLAMTKKQIKIQASSHDQRLAKWRMRWAHLFLNTDWVA